MKIIDFSFYRNFSDAFKLVYATSRKLTVLNFVLTFIQSFFPLIVIYLIKLIIDAIGEVSNSEVAEVSFNHVLMLIIVTALVFLLNAIAGAINEYVRDKQSLLFTDKMNLMLIDKTTSIDLEFFENTEYHDLFSRVLENAREKPLNLVNNLFHIIQSFFAIVTLIILLMTLHWAVFFVILFATLPLALVRLKYSKKMYNWYMDTTQSDRKSNYFYWLLTGIPFAMEVRLFSLKNYIKNHYLELRTSIRDSKFKIIKRKVILESLVHIFAAIAIFSAYAYISYLTVIGMLTIGALVMYFMALQKGFNLFEGMLNGFTYLYEDSLYISYLNRFMNIENKIKESQSDKELPKPLMDGIIVKNLSFRYPNSKRNALSDINMKIKANDTIAIVGDNGSGKSTLIKLLCKFYQPDSGEILFDNIPLSEINDKDLKENVSVLFQNYIQYNLTIKENIILGKSNQAIDEERMIESAKKAGVYDLILSLPHGFDTVLGRLFEGGEELSIGEWQKLALARAFYKDSQLIILDEPTSALDPKAEAQIFNLFKDLTKDKTSIIISHRYSTVQIADYIYVMEKEAIIEEGTHTELLQQKGKYARMFNLQASYYKS
ncbi:MAG: ABC transporter ATP-binding protein, partial [Chitinophagaceae bacterium]